MFPHGCCVGEMVVLVVVIGKKMDLLSDNVDLGFFTYSGIALPISRFCSAFFIPSFKSRTWITKFSSWNNPETNPSCLTKVTQSAHTMAGLADRKVQRRTIRSLHFPLKPPTHVKCDESLLLSTTRNSINNAIESLEL